jgi:hypothetical protein
MSGKGFINTACFNVLSPEMGTLFFPPHCPSHQLSESCLSFLNPEYRKTTGHLTEQQNILFRGRILERSPRDLNSRGQKMLLSRYHPQEE